MTHPALPDWAETLRRRTAGGRDICAAKPHYGSERHARVAGRNALRGDQARLVLDGVTRLFVYACVHCRGWHLTRQERNDPAVTAHDLREGVPS